MVPCGDTVDEEREAAHLCAVASTVETVSCWEVIFLELLSLKLIVL